MISNIEKGKIGERAARKYLIENNYRILDQNYRSKIGEIDIIALYKNILVIIEVKTRTSLNYGYPYEAVNKNKRNKIIKVSQVYLKEKQLRDVQLRYDIIEVYLTNNLRINHIENAFCQ